MPPSSDGPANHRAGSAVTAPSPLHDGPAKLAGRKRFGGETIFKFLSTGSGVFVLVLIIAIAAFLIAKAIPALQANEANFFTFEGWYPDDVEHPKFGIGALVIGTLITAIIALALAVPVALGIALCLSHYAPKRVATTLGFVIDLLAAVPSIIFGLWGLAYLVEPVRALSAWLHRYFGWIPIFGSEGPYGKSLLLGGLVLAIMILPIITALSREVFSQTPKMNEEAALALGATKWEMIRTAVLPYGRPGLIASVMLGLGRALGETIALAMTLGASFVISFDVIEVGGNTIAANIANRFGEAGEIGRGALIASGLVLFAITLVVNVSARAIIFRRREFREAL
ncbi:phosphate transport system permease protein [Allocatelliglobosispora scoriae]|uniref:Phosphate transport system permease protein n=1 Tax=Allocatelliglobosispora scoriae TaxID=643052 RepID=A0A841C1U5_9ACTN|nr:phosphate ABC transporter permease subunit PstC [Allocatelliglobosispora scoriae]MBB5872841.1 phosphate transport system permease protein [Allocatelliglobosispora scoriae]